MNESQNNESQNNEAYDRGEVPTPPGKRGLRTRRVLVPAVAAIAVLGIGGAVWAATADDDLAGAERDMASGVAVEAAGGGTVTEAEEDGGLYELEVTREDGTEVDVRLDKDYTVVSSETDGRDDDGRDDGGRDDGGYDRDGDDVPPTAAESAAAKKSALAEVGSGTVTDVDRDDDGGVGRFEVEVTKSDGTEWSVRLDKDFKVLGSHRDD